jgi:hypothetical protein
MILLFPNSKLYNYRIRRSGEWYSTASRLKEQANFKCQKCGVSEDSIKGVYLNVHHKYYIEAREPWEYDDDAFQVLCGKCHSNIDHTKIMRYPAKYKELLIKKPIILTHCFFENYLRDSLPYNDFFDILYFGRIINCGYKVSFDLDHGLGRFDYILIVREVVGKDSSYSNCASEKLKREGPNNGIWLTELHPDYFRD